MFVHSLFLAYNLTVSIDISVVTFEVYRDLLIYIPDQLFVAGVGVGEKMYAGNQITSAKRYHWLNSRRCAKQRARTLDNVASIDRRFGALAKNRP